MQSALTKISLSFDLWTSKNQLALLGICAHYLDHSGKPISTLLSLPQQTGRHLGVNLAETIGGVISDYNLEDKLGFFITDNADSNSTCLDAMALEFGFDKEQRWIHCVCHVMNLVAQAVLFGKDSDAFEKELLEDITVEELNLAHWRRKGPIGKLHNVVYWICRSPYLKETLEASQLELIAATRPDGKKAVYQLTKDVETRWNSFDDSAVRALYLRPAIDDVDGEDKASLRS